MTVFVTKTDYVDDVMAADINQLITGLQQFPSPHGWPQNYKLSVTVASNNLTVTLKNLAGNDPGVTDPVAVQINGTLRIATVVTAVTKNAATNWANLGSAELATKETDLFVYLVWNTALGSPAIDIFWSRLPFGNLYSDFSATTTNERYAAVNATAPNATDVCVNVGRFAATLSAGAGYTWSVPAYTAANLVQRPIYETRVLTYLPAYTGYTGAVTTNLARYQLVMNRMSHTNRFSGTSNATTLTYTLPFTPALTGNGLYAFCRGTDNSTGNKTAMAGPTSTNVMTAYTDAAASAWTNSGTKGLDCPMFTWDI